MDMEPDQGLIGQTDEHLRPPRTSQRLKYEAEIQVFEKRYGSLESVRKNLGFSQRKMCQMLLVDPSAWTRWHSAGNRPPPHVYRSLEWFLALEGRAELHPRLADLYAKGTKMDGPRAQSSVKELDELRRQIHRLKFLVWAGPLLSLLTFAAWWLR